MTAGHSIAVDQCHRRPSPPHLIVIAGHHHHCVCVCVYVGTRHTHTMRLLIRTLTCKTKEYENQYQYHPKLRGTHCQVSKSLLNNPSPPSPPHAENNILSIVYTFCCFWLFFLQGVLIGKNKTNKTMNPLIRPVNLSKNLQLALVEWRSTRIIIII